MVNNQKLLLFSFFFCGTIQSKPNLRALQSFIHSTFPDDTTPNVNQGSLIDFNDKNGHGNSGGYLVYENGGNGVYFAEPVSQFINSYTNRTSTNTGIDNQVYNVNNDIFYSYGYATNTKNAPVDYSYFDRLIYENTERPTNVTHINPIRNPERFNASQTGVRIIDFKGTNSTNTTLYYDTSPLVITDINNNINTYNEINEINDAALEDVNNKNDTNYTDDTNEATGVSTLNDKVEDVIPLNEIDKNNENNNNTERPYDDEDMVTTLDTLYMGVYTPPVSNITIQPNEDIIEVEDRDLWAFPWDMFRIPPTVTTTQTNADGSTVTYQRNIFTRPLVMNTTQPSKITIVNGNTENLELNNWEKTRLERLTLRDQLSTHFNNQNVNVSSVPYTYVSNIPSTDSNISIDNNNSNNNNNNEVVTNTTTISTYNNGTVVTQTVITSYANGNSTTNLRSLANGNVTKNTNTNTNTANTNNKSTNESRVNILRTAMSDYYASNSLPVSTQSADPSVVIAPIHVRDTTRQSTTYSVSGDSSGKLQFVPKN